MNIWDEKNSIEPEKNSSNNNEQEPNDITISIEKDSTQKVCGDTGNQWKRTCPKCRTDIVYKTKSGRNVAERCGRLCSLCLAKSKRKYDTPDILERYCPSCNKLMTYNHIGRGLSVKRNCYLRDIRENRSCASCSKKGINNGMFGSYREGKDNPNFGNHWNNEQKDRARKISAKRYQERGYTFNAYNRDACNYFDELSLKNGWNLRHAENGGEVLIEGYFLDAYDEKLNIVVEYDEKYHYVRGKLKQNDIDRMNKIVQTLKCEFWRYRETTKELIRYA